ncbi:hypothetical protein [Thiolapillus sp.]|uniref:hypothetical protein n=1 Tax=Thiolapillus sp. TaxID=2017437 RepID=UPI003AF698E9
MREGKGVGKREEEEERGDRRKGGKREVSLANHDRYLWNCPVRVRPLDRPVIYIPICEIRVFDARSIATCRKGDVGSP